MPSRESPSPVSQQPRLYALLIAIDRYDSDPPGNHLNGCVRDSKSVERYLRDLAATQNYELQLRCLRGPLGVDSGETPAESLPRRANIVTAFTEFLTQAGPGDVAFVHFSGHGYYQPLPQALSHLVHDSSSERASEVLICQDSLTWADGRIVPPLFDLEIRWLLSRIAQREPHIVTMWDCCNSGGNTRDFQPQVGVRSLRSATAATSPFTISDFVFYQRDEDLRRQIDEGETQFTIPQGRHLALAACQSFELAKEDFVEPGKKSGLFTYYTLQTLRATRGRVSYRELIKLVRAKVMASTTRQSPQYFSPQDEDADLAFLGGRVADRGAAFVVRPDITPDADRRFGILDAGHLHGLRPVTEGSTQLLLFDPGVDLNAASAGDGIVASVVEVRPTDSKVELQGGSVFADGVEFYSAIITAAPLPPARFRLAYEIDTERVTRDADPMLARGAELVEAAASGNPFVAQSDAAVMHDFSVFVYRFNGEYRLRIAEQDKLAALIPPLTGLNEDNARQLVADLEHIARWRQTLHLDNSVGSAMAPDALSLVALDGDGNEVSTRSGEINLTGAEDRAQAPRLKFKVTLNDRAQRTVYCALLRLKADFSIATDLLPPETHLGAFSYVDRTKPVEHNKFEEYAGAHVLNRGQANPLGQYLRFGMPQGEKEYVEHYKLIASTAQFDPASLRLQALGKATATRSVGALQQPKSALDALLQTVATRSGGEWDVEAEQGDSAPVPDWWTTTIAVRVTRPDV